MKVEESLNVTFNESPPPTKLSPLVDDDVGEEEAIRKNTKIVNTNNEENKSIVVDEIVNIKESKNHLLDQFEMSMIGELNFFLGLQIKQMEDGIFFNQSKYIKEMLKKFGLEDSKPTKMPMSMEIKLTKDDEAESMDSSKYQTTHLEAVKRIFSYIRGTSQLGLWYPKGTGIETVVYVDFNHAGDYIDRKSTSGVCTFMGCCLTSWFNKKQMALAISMTEAEYVSAGKACQQALWMKQALIDYGIRLDDVPIMCDNKGTIDLSKNPVQHSRTKHIEIRHHFLHDNVQKGNISIEKVASEDNIADIFTKPLKREVFNYLRLELGMMELIMDSTKMPSEYQQDYKKIRAYATKIYNDPNMFDALRDIYRTLESRYVHKGRTINSSFYNDLSDDSVAKFTAIGFDCLLSLDEQICRRFIFEFYKTLKLERDSNNHFSIQFIINNHYFNLSLAQFAELTYLPNQGICIYSNAWGLDELEKTLEQIEPYNSRLLALDDI
ncbi:retrovirus-related pol polyprotein from transposon TNT 1-94 [Tanacetum coccineum]|uniref:Retrovirus-related pol polyprotein from transposon TNT 1-94 n=1 Tax=Tanacetum coccineum TaxID=301880 RepID=A0ABQ4X9T5_9ASTR